MPDTAIAPRQTTSVPSRSAHAREDARRFERDRRTGEQDARRERERASPAVGCAA
jgi:hypothetical protein